MPPSLQEPSLPIWYYRLKRSSKWSDHRQNIILTVFQMKDLPIGQTPQIPNPVKFWTQSSLSNLREKTQFKNCFCGHQIVCHMVKIRKTTVLMDFKASWGNDCPESPYKVYMPRLACTSKRKSLVKSTLKNEDLIPVSQFIISLVHLAVFKAKICWKMDRASIKD